MTPEQAGVRLVLAARHLGVAQADGHRRAVRVAGRRRSAIELLTRRASSAFASRGRDDGVTWWLEGRPDEGGRQVLVRRDPTARPSASRPRASTPATGSTNMAARPTCSPATPSSCPTSRPAGSSGSSRRRCWSRSPPTGRGATPTSPGRGPEPDPGHPRGPRPEALARPRRGVNTSSRSSSRAGEVEVARRAAPTSTPRRGLPRTARLAWLEWAHPNLPWDGTELYVAPVGADGGARGRSLVARLAERLGLAAPLVAGRRPALHRRAHGLDAPPPLSRRPRRAASPTAPSSPTLTGSSAPHLRLPRRRRHPRRRSRGGRDRLLRIDAGRRRDRDRAAVHRARRRCAIDGGRVVSSRAGRRPAPAIVELDAATVATRAPAAGRRRSPRPGRRLHAPSPSTFPTRRRPRRATAASTRREPATSRGPTGSSRRSSSRAMAADRPGVRRRSRPGSSCSPSRGIAVLDVDYGGSTGYGRDYRKRLEGTGASPMSTTASPGPASSPSAATSTRRAWRPGGSASGYTTLSALAFRDDFAAGISYFGLGDLLAFARETHKFESRYLDRLIGPLPEAEATTASVHRPSTRSGCRRRCSSSRAPRTGSCRRARRSASSTRCSSAASRMPTCCSRARTTASAARRRSSARSRRSCRSWAQVFGFTPGRRAAAARARPPARPARPSARAQPSRVLAATRPAQAHVPRRPRLRAPARGDRRSPASPVAWASRTRSSSSSAG